ncbi:MAG: outer membrane beta-barrel protein [Dysgonomonas sp.]
MKKLLLLSSALLLFIATSAQEGHKINAGIDMSFGMPYFNSDKNNPIAAGGSIGYEYDFIFFFGVEAGFRFGGFNQKVGYPDPNIGPGGLGETNGNFEDIYRGTFWAPYIAPKLYFPIGYDDKKDRARYVYLENRLSYTRMNLNLNKITNMTGSAHKYRLQYEIRAGYQFPVDDRWAINCWIGYNTFDFSKIKPEAIKFKNATPIQVGIGFNYIIKQ